MVSLIFEDGLFLLGLVSVRLKYSNSKVCMLAVPGPCRFYEEPATGEALVVPDVVVSLHVHGQLLRLHELLRTLGAGEVLNSGVPLLMGVPHLGGLKCPLTPTTSPTWEGSYIRVPHHVALQFMLVMAIPITRWTHVNTFSVVLVHFVR